MSVRLSVTYAGTDGTMPENMEIEWSDDPDPDLLHTIAGLLVAAPSRRLAAERGEQALMGLKDKLATPAPHADADNCARLTCGHAHEDHSAMDDQGAISPDDPHFGSCERCGNYERCRSFVGKTRSPGSQYRAGAPLRSGEKVRMVGDLIYPSLSDRDYEGAMVDSAKVGDLLYYEVATNLKDRIWYKLKGNS